MTKPQAMLLFLGVAACGPPVHPALPDAPPDTPPDTTPDPTPRSTVLTAPAIANPDLDLLFVIDDSPSMLDKQQALVQAFPAFVAQLASAPGGSPNLHLGVVSSDMGTTGSSSAVPGPSIGSGPGSCAGTGKAGNLQTNGSALVTGNFIVDLRDGTRNYTGTLASAFSSIASLGASGCGFEQHLAAMRAALSGNAANAGFVRAGANLGVIVLADEDDCSALSPTLFSADTSVLGPLQSFRCTRFGVQCTPDDWDTAGDRTGCQPRAASPYVEEIAPFKDFLVSLKGDPRRVMFGALVGDPAPVKAELRTPPGGGTAVMALAHSCTYTIGNGTAVADPAVRLANLVSTYPGPARLESVCSADLTAAITNVGATLKRLVGDTCLQAVPAMPLDCVVTDTRDSSPGTKIEIPKCGSGGAGDCYDLVADPTCTDAPHLRLQVTRTAPPAADTWTTVACTR